MKIPEMLESNPATTAAAIARFEIDHSLKLPTAYVDFLLRTNGGVPKNSSFPVLGRPTNLEENVQDFLGIGVAAFPMSELTYPINFYEGGLPAQILPIANQDLGSFVCLDLRQNGVRVAFWDHRHFWGTGEWREQDLYHVADSFEEFLTLLRPIPR